MKSAALIFASLLILSACAGDVQRPAPVTTYGGTLGAGTLGVHTVSSGETLWKIAERYRMGVQDIAVLNRLQPPFHLHDGQRLRLPPPQEYRVRKGDSLYQVSRVFGTSQTELARINNLKPPYNLIPGHKLRLPAPAVKMPPPAPEPKPAVQTAARAYEPPSIYDEYQKNYPVKEPPPKPQTPQQQEQQAWSPPPQPEPVYQEPAPTAPVKKEKVTAKTPPRAGSKFMRPVGGKVISGYGPKPDGLHNDGINIKAPAGAPVRAAENGVVVYAGNELKGSGNLVLVRHADRWMSAYGHLDRILVKRGAIVNRGESLGTVGSTGSVSEPQLHFELRRGTEAVNPEKYLE